MANLPQTVFKHSTHYLYVVHNIKDRYKIRRTYVYADVVPSIL